MINRLRTTDLDDDNAIKRRTGMTAPATLAGRVRESAPSGTNETFRGEGAAVDHSLFATTGC